MPKSHHHHFVCNTLTDSMDGELQRLETIEKLCRQLAGLMLDASETKIFFSSKDVTYNPKSRD